MLRLVVVVQVKIKVQLPTLGIGKELFVDIESPIRQADMVDFTAVKGLKWLRAHLGVRRLGRQRLSRGRKGNDEATGGADRGQGEQTCNSQQRRNRAQDHTGNEPRDGN